MDKNFGLTEVNFNVLLEELNNGNDALFEKVFLTHFQACQIYLIRNYNASKEDAYDATMNTLLEFHDRLKGGKVKYGNLRFLFTRMACQVYIKWIKKEKVKESIIDFNLQDAPNELDEESFKILDKAWENLGEQCKNLLKGFYYKDISLNHIAESMQKSHAATRKQKQRCVQKLRSLFVKNS